MTAEGDVHRAADRSHPRGEPTRDQAGRPGARVDLGHGAGHAVGDVDPAVRTDSAPEGPAEAGHEDAGVAWCVVAGWAPGLRPGPM